MCTNAVNRFFLPFNINCNLIESQGACFIFANSDAFTDLKLSAKREREKGLHISAKPNI